MEVTHFEEVTIDNKKIVLTHDEVALDKIVLDDDNPRIRYRLKLHVNGKGDLDNVILNLPEVKALSKDIERNGGLRERVILQQINGKYKAIEGNCRVACLRKLAKNNSDPRWKMVPAKILAPEVEPKHVAIMLADFHVAQKIVWKPHEKAGHVYRMLHDLGMTPDEVATYLRASKSTVYRLDRAYQFMVERFLTIDNKKYEKEGERKWSYFEEFFKQKELQKRLEKDPEFGDDFCRWVGEGRLPEGENVRHLPDILGSPDAMKKLLKLEKDIAFGEAKKVVDQTEPERASDFFKLLAKFREACRDAAQVKEILLIRSNKAARERVLQTYEAFVDFMRLADVEPPQIGN
jgi:hypothetical protein